MKPDQERVKNLLSDTVTLLCKNGLHYQKEMKVQGLLGITLDENEVFVVHINEKFGDLIGSSAVSVTTDPEDDAPHLSVGKPTTSPGKSRDGGSRSHTVDLTDGEEHRPPRAKKRRSSRDGATSPSSASAHSDSQSLPATSPASRHTDTLSSPGTSVGDHDRLDVPPEISIKKEHDILAGKGRDRSSCAQGSGATSRQRDDRNAMRETYSGLSLSDIQSGLAHLEQIPNLEGEVSGDGDDSVRQSTPGSSQDQSVSKDSPFITGLVRHQRGASSGQGDDSTGSAWDSSFGGTMPDQAAPGSSTWDPSQLPAARLQGTGGEESMDSNGGDNKDVAMCPEIRKVLADKDSAHALDALPPYVPHHLSQLEKMAASAKELAERRHAEQIMRMPVFPMTEYLMTQPDAHLGLSQVSDSKIGDNDKYGSPKYPPYTFSDAMAAAFSAGTRNYKCETCNKWYLTRDNLKRHQKVHNPHLHRCKRCTLFFSSAEALNAHREKKHNYCSVCQQEFSRKTNHVCKRPDL